MLAKNNLTVSVVLICALVLSFVVCATAQSIDNYEPGPDSKVQPNVPKGEVLKFTFANSQTAIPDGGATIALLGVGLLGLGALRRKL